MQWCRLCRLDQCLYFSVKRVTATEADAERRTTKSTSTRRWRGVLPSLRCRRRAQRPLEQALSFERETKISSLPRVRLSRCLTEQDSPSANSLVAASAYTLTQSSVPLGLTKLLPLSVFATIASTPACNPSGVTTFLSASSVLKAYRSLTNTLTNRLGRSVYAASHSPGPHLRCKRTVSTRSMSLKASPTV